MEMLLQLQLDWAKDKDKDKKEKNMSLTQFKTFLDHRSRMRRCGFLVLLGDRFSRPRPISLSIFRYTSTTDLGARIASLAKREWRPT